MHSEICSHKWDVIVIGAGLSGLYTALCLDKSLSILVVTKKGLKDCNSYLAQGGIAAVLSEDDTYKAHIEDTLAAGQYDNNLRRVEEMIIKGPSVIKSLIDFGVPFDRKENGDLLLAREGGHSHRRVARVGDHTGRHIMEVLGRQVVQRKKIQLLQDSQVVELLVEANQVKGLIAEIDRQQVTICGRHLVLATGGIGQLHDHTTNDSTIEGDGFKMALKAGLSLTQMDCIQYHPTAFYEDNDKKQRFLISEALRGEGAVIRDNHGKDIMAGVHPLGALAPRDVVVKQMRQVMKRDQSAYCYLDASHLDKDYLSTHFPSIYTYCNQAGYDMAVDFIPVVPCVHYLMGGLAINEAGETALTNLYACGEVAYTGFHGRNRLASNSLLECLVTGQSVAQTINKREGTND